MKVERGEGSYGSKGQKIRNWALEFTHNILERIEKEKERKKED